MKGKAKEKGPPTDSSDATRLTTVVTTPRRAGARGPGMRRSQRVLLSVPVTVYGRSAEGEVFDEATVTMMVNADGGLLTLRKKVHRKQELYVRNENTGSEIKCAVAHVSPAEGGRMEVGISFSEDAPGFWGVYFPSDDLAAKPRNSDSADTDRRQPPSRD